MYVYKYARYKSDESQDHETLEDCIRAALSDLETGDAWPLGIYDGQMVALWFMHGPLGCGESLVEFAARHGINVEL